MSAGTNLVLEGIDENGPCKVSQRAARRLRRVSPGHLPYVFLVCVLATGLLLLAEPVLASTDQREAIGIVDSGGDWKLVDPVTAGQLTFTFGNPGDVAFMGDWDCDGIATPGLYRRSTGQAFLRNSNTTGVADITFVFGNPGDIPLAGDFDSSGCDSLSIYRPAEARFYIINRLGSDGRGLGAADLDYFFGDPGDVPFVGDWNGDGTDTVGLRRASNGFVYLRNSHQGGSADLAFFYGDRNDVPFAGDWDGDGIDTLGLYRPASATTYLRNSNSTGIADVTLRKGRGQPVAGFFGDLPDPPPEPALTLDMVPREDWGAREAETWRMFPHVISRMTIHHAGTQQSTTGPSRYRGWQSWHMDGRGWPDLAYHVIIGVDGTIYEGRDPTYRGDTGTSYDTHGHFLVVVEGNFDIDYPTPAQWESLVAILAWAAEEYGVSPDTISGHQDHAATSCPGEHLDERIASGELLAAVEDLMAEGGVGLDWP
ncbi:MAG TPA: peptidoglycan recognition family protein [Acidimicrobiia bacterium]|nr:peptidoglycan recognition family protein [Acidimicrobiia bacterium]